MSFYRIIIIMNYNKVFDIEALQQYTIVSDSDILGTSS